MRRSICNQDFQPLSLARHSSQTIMAEDTIVVTHALQAQRGDKKFLLDHNTVSGIPCIAMQKKNQGLAKLCKAITDKRYFRGTDVFRYLVQKRNEQVSKLIKLAAKADDPFAEMERAEDDVADEPDDDDENVNGGRQELFLKHKIPEIIQLSIPEFKLDNIDYDAVSIQVLATPNVCASVCMAATSATLGWFKDAWRYSWLGESDSPIKRKVIDDDFQLDSESAVKVARNDATKLELHCYYKKSCGRYAKKQMSLMKSNYDSADELSEAMMKMATRMDEFYQKNHVGGDGHGDADGEDADTEA